MFSMHKGCVCVEAVFEQKDEEFHLGFVEFQKVMNHPTRNIREAAKYTELGKRRMF